MLHSDWRRGDNVSIGENEEQKRDEDYGETIHDSIDVETDDYSQVWHWSELLLVDYLNVLRKSASATQTFKRMDRR